MPVNLRALKADLRAAMLARREALSFADAYAHSAVIADTVLSLPIYTDAQTVAGYMSIGKEVQTDALLHAALAAGKRVVLPRTVLSERRLALHAVTDFAALLPGPFGIREPSPATPEVSPTEVELFLVPGSVFDSAGNRIGYGKGLYDSLLVMSEGWRVGLAYAVQLAPRVPTAEHDMPMDLIVSDRGILDCGKGQLAGDHLRLRNMVFYGHHGAFPQEREQGIRLAMDLDMRLDLQLPGCTDELATTVNYPAVYTLIQQIQSGRQFALFETMVEHIAAAILQHFPPVAEVTVTARKFNPPVGGLLDAFEVEIVRSRPSWMRPHGV